MCKTKYRARGIRLQYYEIECTRKQSYTISGRAHKSRRRRSSWRRCHHSPLQIHTIDFEFKLLNGFTCARMNICLERLLGIVGVDEGGREEKSHT
eukprot:scaffold10667_cov91-Skeletonema_menzelii.AAC.1